MNFQDKCNKLIESMMKEYEVPEHQMYFYILSIKTQLFEQKIDKLKNEVTTIAFKANQKIQHEKFLFDQFKRYEFSERCIQIKDNLWFVASWETPCILVEYKDDGQLSCYVEKPFDLPNYNDYTDEELMDKVKSLLPFI